MGGRDINICYDLPTALTGQSLDWKLIIAPLFPPPLPPLPPLLPPLPPVAGAGVDGWELGVLGWEEGGGLDLQRRLRPRRERDQLGASAGDATGAGLRRMTAAWRA